MISVEIWRAIPGHPKYEVSNMGNVRALGYTKLKATGMVGPRRNYVGVQLSNPNRTPIREYRQNLARSGMSNADIEKAITERGLDRAVNARVHRLVLAAFVGPCPDGMVGCHIDGDPLNNRLDNLRWDTPSNNERDKRAHGTGYQTSKTHCPQGHEYTEDNTYGGANSKARRCKTCARERARNQAAAVNPRTHCRKGHEFTAANTVTYGNARKCRTCRDARNLERDRARKSS